MNSTSDRLVATLIETAPEIREEGLTVIYDQANQSYQKYPSARGMTGSTGGPLTKKQKAAQRKQHAAWLESHEYGITLTLAFQDLPEKQVVLDHLISLCQELATEPTFEYEVRRTPVQPAAMGTRISSAHQADAIAVDQTNEAYRQSIVDGLIASGAFRPEDNPQENEYENYEEGMEESAAMVLWRVKRAIKDQQSYDPSWYESYEIYPAQPGTFLLTLTCLKSSALWQSLLAYGLITLQGMYYASPPA